MPSTWWSRWPSPSADSARPGRADSRAHEAGVKTAFGSDLLGGMHRHQNKQFRLLGKVQPAIDAIR